MTAATKEKTQRDLTALLELWATATPEARRASLVPRARDFQRQ